MRAIVLNSDGYEVRDIEDSLSSYQSIVGGYIQIITLPNGIDIVFNEEGKLMGLETTVYLDWKGEIVDTLEGTLVFVGVKGAGFTDLTDEQIEYLEEDFGNDAVFNEETGELYPIIKWR